MVHVRNPRRAKSFWNGYFGICEVYYAKEGRGRKRVMNH
jgi:hypothetical protein